MSLSVLWCIFKGALNAFASHAVDRWGTWILSTFSCKRKAHVPICLPYQEFVCPAFLQASTRQPLARMQEIVGRTNVMAIRFSLFLLSLVPTMPVSFTGCHKLSHNQRKCFCGSHRDHVGTLRGCNLATVRKANHLLVLAWLGRMVLLRWRQQDSDQSRKGKWTVRFPNR